MDYFTFDGFSPAEGQRFNNYIESQDAAFRRQDAFKFGNGQYLGFHINQPAKGAFRANEQGSITLRREAGQPNLRTRISPQWQGDSQRWRYLKLDQPYLFEVDFWMHNRDDDYRSVT